MRGKLGFAVTFWFITLLALALVLLPIYLNVGDRYDFYIENAFFVFIFITFTRFIFFTKHHWFSHNSKVKVVLVFVAIPISLYLVDSIYDFQTFMDEEGINSILTDLNFNIQDSLGKYIKTEMMLFWVSAMVATFFLPLRMIHSIWRLNHRGKV